MLCCLLSYFFYPFTRLGSLGSGVKKIAVTVAICNGVFYGPTMQQFKTDSAANVAISILNYFKSVKKPLLI